MKYLILLISGLLCIICASSKINNMDDGITADSVSPYKFGTPPRTPSISLDYRILRDSLLYKISDRGLDSLWQNNTIEFGRSELLAKEMMQRYGIKRYTDSALMLKHFGRPDDKIVTMKPFPRYPNDWGGGSLPYTQYFYIYYEKWSNNTEIRFWYTFSYNANDSLLGIVCDDLNLRME